jgi:hypothetical protein
MGEFALPAAPPQRYLRWMAYWREVESQMLSNPAVEAVASREAAPFLRGEIAAFSSTIVGTIVDAAMGAKEAGLELVVPVIELPDPEVARAIADLVERRGAWLDSHAGSLGIAPLEPELVALRSQAIAMLRAAS